MAYYGPRVRREAHVATPFASALSSGFQAFDAQRGRDRMDRAEGREVEAHDSRMLSSRLNQAGAAENLETSGVREGERPAMVQGTDPMSMATNAVNAERFRDLPGVEGFYLDRFETPDAIQQERMRATKATNEAANRALYEGQPEHIRRLIGGYAPGMDVQDAIKGAWDYTEHREVEAGRNWRHGQEQSGEDRRIGLRGQQERNTISFRTGQERESRIPLSMDQALSQATEMLTSPEEGLTAPPAVVQALADALMQGTPADEAIERAFTIDEFGGQMPSWQRRDRAAQPPAGMSMQPQQQLGVQPLEGEMAPEVAPDSARPAVELPQLRIPGTTQLGQFSIEPPPGGIRIGPESEKLAQTDPVFRAWLEKRGYTITEGPPTTRTRNP